MNNRDEIYRFLQYGAEIAGASAGAAAELFAKELVPSGGGGVIGSVVASALKEFGARILSDRELAAWAE